MLTYNPATRISAEEALLAPWLRRRDERPGSKADIKSSLSRLERFSTQIHLQKAVLTYIATQKLEPHEEARLKQLFNLFDIDKDGDISFEELVAGYYKVHGDLTKARAEARKIMQRVDLNKNGIISFTEFKVANLKISEFLVEQRLQEAFAFYDRVRLLSTLRMAMDRSLSPNSDKFLVPSLTTPPFSA